MNNSAVFLVLSDFLSAIRNKQLRRNVSKTHLRLPETIEYNGIQFYLVVVSVPFPLLKGQLTIVTRF